MTIPIQTLHVSWWGFWLIIIGVLVLAWTWFFSLKSEKWPKNFQWTLPASLALGLCLLFAGGWLFGDSINVPGDAIYNPTANFGTTRYITIGQQNEFLKEEYHLTALDKDSTTRYRDAQGRTYSNCVASYDSVTAIAARLTALQCGGKNILHK